MKRYVSIDFMRGIAIMLMIGLHVFIRTWNTNVLIEGMQGGNIGFALIAIVVVYFASFAGLFITVSAMGNLFSMHAQYLKLKEKTPNAAKIVLKNQLIRGGIMAFMGVFITCFLWPYLYQLPVAWLINDPLEGYWQQWYGNLYWIDVLTFIGLATMIVAVVYTSMLQKNKSIPEIRKALGRIAAIIFITTPFILYAIRSVSINGFPFWPRPMNNIEERGFGVNLLYFILDLIGGKNQGLFPWLAMAFIGTAMALDLVEGPVTKQFKKKWVKIGLIMLILGFLLQIIFAGIASALPDDQKIFFEFGFGTLFGTDGPSSAYRLFVDGGELILLALLLNMVEGNRRAKAFAKRTVPIRRAGMMTLTLYSLQFLALVPIVLIQSYIFKYPLASSYSATIGQSLITIVAVMLIFITIPWLWEKMQFKWTLEWTIARIMAKGNSNSMDRLNAQGYLYDVEPLGEAIEKTSPVVEK